MYLGTALATVPVYAALPQGQTGGQEGGDITTDLSANNTKLNGVQSTAIGYLYSGESASASATGKITTVTASNNDSSLAQIFATALRVNSGASNSIFNIASNGTFSIGTVQATSTNSGATVQAAAWDNGGFATTGTQTINGSLHVDNVIATGGRSLAYGLKSNNLTLKGDFIADNISATAASGKEATAEGIRAGGSTQIQGGFSATATATGDSIAYAYGMHSITPNAAMTVAGATNLQIKALAAGDNAKLKAYGVSTSSNKVQLNGDVTIKAVADRAVYTHPEAYAYSLYADSWGEITVNNSKANTVKLVGDVLLADSGSNVNLNLTNSSSYLQGNVLKANNSGSLNFNLANGAVWQPAYDDRNGTLTWAGANGKTNLYSATTNYVDSINMDGGIIDLTWDDSIRTTTARNVTVGTLGGSGGTVKINTNLANDSGDTLTVNNATGSPTIKVQIGYDPTVASTGIVTTNGYDILKGTAKDNINLEGAVSDIGAYRIVPVFSGGRLQNVKEPVSASENTKIAADVAGSMNMVSVGMVMAETNSLQKRMGELRDNVSDSGTWVRYQKGTLEKRNDRTSGLNYNLMQFGYDKDKVVKDGKMYDGILISHISGDTSYASGSGDTNSTTIGLYKTWIGEKGHYYDVLLKHGRIANSYNVTDLSANYSTADYSTNSTILSGEYGMRKQLAKEWYIEPQGEIILGHINGIDYTTSSGMQVEQAGVNQAITRLGVAYGRKMDKGSFYTKASYYHNFGGDINIKATSLDYSDSAARNWYELAIGGTAELGNGTNLYAEVEKLYGDMKSNVQWNVGIRRNF